MDPPTSSINRSRPLLFIRLLTLIALGLTTKAYDGPAASWIRGSLGGAFYVAFWMVAWLLVRPRTPVVPLAATVLALTCGIEFLQLVHADWLDALRATRVGGTLLGSTFAWADLPAYFGGAALGVVLTRSRPSRPAT